MVKWRYLEIELIVIIRAIQLETQWLAVLEHRVLEIQDNAVITTCLFRINIK